MTARRWTGGGLPVPSGAHAATRDGEPRRNLNIAFENLSSASALPDLEAGRPAFKRSNLAQAVIDGIAVIYLPLFGSLLAASFGVAFYIVLFVGTR